MTINLLRKAFSLGFSISSEGYNTGYPFNGEDEAFEADRDWQERRDAILSRFLRENVFKETVDGESELKACAREAGWALIETVDEIEWTKRERVSEIISRLGVELQPERSFQGRVEPWLNDCFGNVIAIDKVERCDRFIEEALELIQAVGYSSDRAHALVDYVFNRPAGEPFQEVGGVEVTLASLCLAVGIDKEKAAETELARVWTKVEKIRAKQAAKPTGSALPGVAIRDPDLVQHRIHWTDSGKPDGPTEWREGDGEGLYPESPYLRIEVRKLYAGN